jgi:hypothetical protein
MRFRAQFPHSPVGALLTCKLRKTGFRGGWVDPERPKPRRQDPFFLVSEGVSTVFEVRGGPPPRGSKNDVFFHVFWFWHDAFFDLSTKVPKITKTGSKKDPPRILNNPSLLLFFLFDPCRVRSRFRTSRFLTKTVTIKLQKRRFLTRFFTVF